MNHQSYFTHLHSNQELQRVCYRPPLNFPVPQYYHLPQYAGGHPAWLTANQVAILPRQETFHQPGYSATPGSYGYDGRFGAQRYPTSCRSLPAHRSPQYIPERSSIQLESVEHSYRKEFRSGSPLRDVPCSTLGLSKTVDRLLPTVIRPLGRDEDIRSICAVNGSTASIAMAQPAIAVAEPISLTSADMARKQKPPSINSSVTKSEQQHLDTLGCVPSKGFKTLELGKYIGRWQSITTQAG